MSDDQELSIRELKVARLDEHKAYFEEKERRVLEGELYKENADDDSMLFDEYLQLHWEYGEKRPRGESGLVVYYRKLLRLPVDAEE
ncbi:MAG: hypothetical protein JNG89_15430 [Planctomycetaceae bacterium]|nr:hypothetical protein [Planctomycetaceae bacterium]